jgi:hydrogenase assembly chaperone HypC/HupF
MCVAYPARVVAVEGDGVALAELSGRPRRVLLTLVGGAAEPGRPGDRVAVGDWLLVQSGIALARLTREEVEERIRVLETAFEGETDE